VEPCPRPKEKPPPETEVLPYYPGAYVENATTVTLKLELARPLRYLDEIEPERSGGAKSTDELQRLVALIRYDDTPTLLALMRIITDVNHAADMLSASNWESYKDAWREELDVISGVQLVDGEVVRGRAWGRGRGRGRVRVRVRVRAPYAAGRRRGG
jgi:hypothetical protein